MFNLPYIHGPRRNTYQRLYGRLDSCLARYTRPSADPLPRHLTTRFLSSPGNRVYDHPHLIRGGPDGKVCTPSTYIRRHAEHGRATNTPAASLSAQHTARSRRSPSFSFSFNPSILVCQHTFLQHEEPRCHRCPRLGPHHSSRGRPRVFVRPVYVTL